MARNKIYKMCIKCQGAGVLEVIIGYDQQNKPIYQEQPCDDCKGVKELYWGSISKE